MSNLPDESTITMSKQNTIVEKAQRKATTKTLPGSSRFKPKEQTSTVRREHEVASLAEEVPLHIKSFLIHPNILNQTTYRERLNKAIMNMETKSS